MAKIVRKNDPIGLSIVKPGGRNDAPMVVFDERSNFAFRIIAFAKSNTDDEQGYVVQVKKANGPKMYVKRLQKSPSYAIGFWSPGSVGSHLIDRPVARALIG